MFLKRGFHLIASKSLAENLPFDDFLKITAINGVIVSRVVDEATSPARHRTFLLIVYVAVFIPPTKNLGASPRVEEVCAEEIGKSLGEAGLVASSITATNVYQIPTDVSKSISN